MQLIIDTANTTITVKNKCFYIQNETTSRKISPKRIDSVAILSNCTLSSAAIRLAARHQVAILFFTHFGTIQARLWSPYFTNIADLRKKQLLFSMHPLATQWIISQLKLKTQEQIVNLKRLAKRELKQEVSAAEAIEKITAMLPKFDAIQDVPIQEVRGRLMGYEGNISRFYFQALNLFLPESFRFEKRSRRPAMDYFNAGLNYLYGMTYSVVEGGVFAKGLDPFIGFMHTDLYKKPTLVFDLIEPIRPLVDRILLRLIKEKQLEPKHFIKKEQGYWVNKLGKRIIIQSFNQFLHTRIEVAGKRRRLKDHIYNGSNELGNFIEGSIQTDDVFDII